MKKQYTKHAFATVDWRDKSQIGRVMPPIGSNVFAMTAKFVDDNEPELFSVILQYPFVDNLIEGSQEDVDLHFFAPQLILPKLKIGTILYLTDGPKILGEAKIVGLAEDSVAQ